MIMPNECKAESGVIFVVDKKGSSSSESKPAIKLFIVLTWKASRIK